MFDIHKYTICNHNSRIQQMELTARISQELNKI